MSKPVKVWAVSSGSYSSYMVHALFTTKKAAKAAIAGEWGPSFYPEIEKFDLYEEAPPPYVERRMECRVGLDGRLVTSVFWDGDPGEWDSTHRYLGIDTGYHHDLRIEEDHREARSAHDWSLPELYHLVVSGNDPEQVAKVYGEHKAALMARLAGLTV